MGHDTVSVLFVDNSSHTILISVLSSIMSRPDILNGKKVLDARMEKMIWTPTYPRPACNPLTLCTPLILVATWIPTSFLAGGVFDRCDVVKIGHDLRKCFHTRSRVRCAMIWQSAVTRSAAEKPDRRKLSLSTDRQYLQG